MEKIVGYIVADARTKDFESGKSVVNFTVAENRSIPDGSGGYKQVTRYFSCSYWITKAIAPYLTKGKLVAVEGIIDAGAYVDKETGNAVATLKLNTQQIHLYSSRQVAKGTQAPAASVATPPKVSAAESVDDLPF